MLTGPTFLFPSSTTTVSSLLNRPSRPTLDLPTLPESRILCDGFRVFLSPSFYGTVEGREWSRRTTDFDGPVVNCSFGPFAKRLGP